MELAAFTVMWLGLALFALLAGADFGVGFWVLASYFTKRGRELRRDAFGYFAPVWEVNFLFLVFIMVALMGSFPRGLGLLADALIPLVLAALVLFVVRSAAYAMLHHGPERTRTPATWVFAIASIVAGVSLGYTAAAPASGYITERSVPPEYYTSPIALASLPLTLAASAHLSALAVAAYGDTRGSGQTEWYRWAALGAGAVVLPCAAIFTWGILTQVEHTSERLQGPYIIPMLVGGAIIFLGTVALWRRRYAPAALLTFIGYLCGLLGGAFAQLPYLVYPAMTVSEAAAPRESIVAWMIATGLGAPFLIFAMLALYHTTLGPQRERTKRRRSGSSVSPGAG